MAQYITTFSFGTLSLHLSHTEQQVFSRRHHTTGGSSMGGVVFRRGQFCDARLPRHILDGAELRWRIMLAPPRISAMIGHGPRHPRTHP